MLPLSVLQVQSKIMYNNDHPDWNQVLKIGIQFPSMCERLKFIVRDWYVSKEFQFIVKLNLDDTVLIYFFFVNDFSFKYAVCYQLFIYCHMNHIMIYWPWPQEYVIWLNGHKKTKSSTNISWLIYDNVKLHLHDISYYLDCSKFPIPLDVVIVYF